MAKQSKAIQQIAKAFTLPETIDYVDLTDDQKKKWESTLILFGWACPGFKHLLYKLLTHHKRADTDVAWFTTAIPTAATDQKNVLINPDYYFALGLPERVFVLAHEIVHNVLRDVDQLAGCVGTGKVGLDDGSVLPFSEPHTQAAMDYRINASLISSRIGAVPTNEEGKTGCYYDPKIATEMDGWRETYRKIMEDDDDGDGPGTGGKYPQGGGYDIVLAPGVTAPDSAPPNQQQWETEVEVARHIDKMAGALSQSMALIYKDLLEPEVPWTDVIKAMVRRNTGGGGYNWRKGDRRYLTRDFFLPARTGFGAGWIVVWGDTSGSTYGDPTNIASYISELTEIMVEVKPRRLTILWGDADLTEIEEIEEAEDMETVKPKGGGGTDVNPAFRWIDEQQDVPELFIGFTDGYFTFPTQAPHYATIWAMVTDEDVPWGERVRINTKAKGAGV